MTNYTYRADGVKVKKLFNGLETDYLDGFQYKFTHTWEAPSGTMTNDEMKLRIIPTSEGYYDALRNAYFYNYTDHLGNVRVSYSDRDGNNEVTGDIVVNNCYNTPDGMVCNNYIITGEAEGVTNYYPFGMIHNSEYNNFDNAYQNKYNGKELQETGMYDYGARFYMPDVGRWGVVDPLAESSRRFTPYHYGNNNPVRFIDPDGRLTMDNLNTYSNGSAVADFMNKNGFGDDQMPMFYRDEAGMMIVNQALGNDGQGGGGTMGGLMDAVGIAMDGGIGSYEQAIGGLSLWQQLVDAGYGNDPANTKAKFSDIYTLVKNVPSLKAIYEKFTAERSVRFQDGGTIFPGQYLQQTNIIAFNMKEIANILQLAFTGGHEMLHLHDSYYINRGLREYFGITTVGTAAISLYGEYRSYTWMNNVGYKDSNGNSINVLRVVKHYSEQLNQETKSTIGTRAYEMLLQNLNILNNKYKLP